MKSDYLLGRYVKRKGLLTHVTLKDSKEFELFVSSVKEGQLVDFFYEVTNEDGTLPQLAKIHAMIKQLSMHTGETFENMKLLVKDRAGLCLAREVAGKEYFIAKSFGECSKEELSLAIQAAIEIGEQVNFIL